MGQHKHNPTAIKAKNGEIKPKEKAMTKAQQKRAIEAAAKSALYNLFLFSFNISVSVKLSTKTCK